MIDEIAVERAHNRRGARVSLIIHAVMLVLALIPACKYEKAADNQYAVMLNFEEVIPPKPEKLVEFKESAQSNKAKEKEGESRKNADKVSEIKKQESKPIEVKKPEIKLPKPTPTPPKPTDPVVSETTVEEVEEVNAAEEEVEIEEIEPEPVPDPAPAPDPEPVPEPAQPEVKESTRDKISKILKELNEKGGSDDQGNPDGDPSRSDGTDSGTGEGEKGDGRGNDADGNDGDSGIGDGGAGEGAYDGSGDGVFGRRVIHRNIAEILRVKFENQEGKRIVAKFCVNRAGNVTFAELLDFETTAVIPRGKEKAVLKGIYGYKVEPDRKAPKEQCGKLSIVLSKINAFN